MKALYALPLLLMGAVALTGCAPEEASGETVIVKDDGDPDSIVVQNDTPDVNIDGGDINVDGGDSKTDVDVDADGGEDAKDQDKKVKEAPEKGDDVAVFETGEGKIVIMFYPEVAPNHVTHFKKLIKSGFYDGTRFHRNIEGFMVQGGDPLSKDKANAPMWGTGGYEENGREVNINQEFNEVKHERGIVSTARGPSENSASSQFFLMHQDYPSLNGQYTVWGKIVEGIEVVDKIVKTGDPRDNGATSPDDAVVLKKATIKTWPLQ